MGDTAAMDSPTRRERLRAETLAEIKDAALTQVAEQGAPALSVRAVARAIGMSPAGLYRYYEGRDALLTDLITDAYNSLADEVEAAIDAFADRPTIERFLAGVRAYRRWAVGEPNRFLLIFGTPVPGYAAPEGGPTVDANRRMGEAFFRLAGEGWAKGELRPPQLSRETTRGEDLLAGDIRRSVPDFPAELVPRMMGAWAGWHGLISLEVTNQFQWLYDDVEVFVDAELEQIAHRLGF